MVTSREKIKEWFKTGAKPTQEQFYDWIDSYWHKYDDVSGILNQMQGATYMGEAHPDDVPPVTKQKVFYTATSAGTYTNFAGAVLASGEKAILLYDKAWSKITLSEIAQELGDSKDVAVSQKVVQSEIKRINNTIKEQIVQDFGQNTAKAISQKVVSEKFGEVETLAKAKVAKQQSAEQGNVVMFGKGGEVADSNIEASNVAKQNGYYESMIVGASKNLAGNNIITAKYTYRPTADTIDVADGVAKISSVKGNTIVWNQMIDINKISSTSIQYYNNSEHFTFTKNNGAMIISCEEFAGSNVGSSYNVISRISLQFLKGRKYLFLYHHNGTYINYAKLGLYDGTNYVFIHIGNIDKTKTAYYFTPTEDITSSSIRLDCYMNAENYGKAQTITITPQVFDLTQMFGEGNEPTLEEFEAMFPNDYYEYNEGELRSIEDFQIKSVGFNLFNKTKVESESYLHYNTGISTYSKGLKESVSDFIRVIPNTKYYAKNIISSMHRDTWAYDSNKIPLMRIPVRNTEAIDNKHLGRSEITIPANAHYIRLGIYDEYLDSTCINLSHSGIRDGEYEPYQEDILPINISTIKDENGKQLFPNGLCSAGEAHDELIYDKGIGKWKAVKRIGSVDMGTLSWEKNGAVSETVYQYIVRNWNNKIGSMCIYVPQSFIVSLTIRANNGIIDLNSTIISDIITLKQSLQGQILYYELAEPIEVVLDDFTSNYKVSDWGTEEILMNSTPIVPVIYDVEYALNAVDTLRNMPTNYISKESLDAFLSTLGSAMGGTWTATYNETNGRYDFSFSSNTSATELTE